MGLLPAHELLSPCTLPSLLVSAPEKAQAENSDEGAEREMTPMADIGLASAGIVGGNPEACISPRASPQILGE